MDLELDRAAETDYSDAQDVLERAVNTLDNGLGRERQALLDLLDAELGTAPSGAPPLIPSLTPFSS